MTRKAPKFRIALSIAFAASVLFVIPTAYAAPGGGGGKSSGSLTLVLLNSADGLPHWGQQVTFDVSTTADRPFVSVNCSQNGTVVYSASAGFFADYLWPWERNFTLKSTYWTGGAADCSATLYYYDGHRTRTLTSLAFHVYA